MPTITVKGKPINVPVDCGCKRTHHLTPVVHCKNCLKWYCPRCATLNDEAKKLRTKQVDENRKKAGGTYHINECVTGGCKGKIPAGLFTHRVVPQRASGIIYDVPLVLNWAHKQYGPLCWYFATQMMLNFHDYKVNNEAYLLSVMEVMVDALIFRNKSTRGLDPYSDIKDQKENFVGRYVRWVKLGRPQSFYTIAGSGDLYLTEAEAQKAAGPKPKDLAKVQSKRIADQHYHAATVNANWAGLSAEVLLLLNDPAFVQTIIGNFDRHGETLVTSRNDFVKVFVPEFSLMSDHEVDTMFLSPDALHLALSAHGPLVCGGNLFPKSKTEVTISPPQQYYHFSSTTARKIFALSKASNEAHAVLLCGLSIGEDGGTVYFIDPNASKPLVSTSFEEFKGEILRYRYEGMGKRANLAYLRCPLCMGVEGKKNGHCARKGFTPVSFEAATEAAAVIGKHWKSYRVRHRFLDVVKDAVKAQSEAADT